MTFDKSTAMLGSMRTVDVPPARTGTLAPLTIKPVIADAKSLPFSETVDEATNLLTPSAALQKLFADAGVKPGDTVVAYCHIGQQATQVVLAARTLGFKAVLYDGSFEEWSRKDYPVDNPAAKQDQ